MSVEAAEATEATRYPSASPPKPTCDQDREVRLCRRSR